MTTKMSLFRPLATLYAKLHEELTRDEEKKILQLLVGAQITIQESRELNGVTEIFLCLERKGLIAEDNLNLIKQIIEAINRRPLLKHVFELESALEKDASKYYGALRSISDQDVKKKVYRGRIMLVGASGSGKTSTKRSLLKEEYVPYHESTDGADIYSIDVTKWTIKESDKDHHGSRSIETTENIIVETYVASMQTGSQVKEGKASDEHMKRKSLVEEEKTSYGHLSNIQERVVEQLVQREKTLKDVDKPDIHISLWDFAGQTIYYITHQAFLGNRVIYLLVTDLTKSLEDTLSATLTDQNLHEDRTVSEWKVKDFLCFWLNSIKSYCRINEDGKSSNKTDPRVIIIGTKKDMLEEKAVSTKLEEIESYVMSNAANDQVVDIMAIDNKSIGDISVEELRDKIRTLIMNENKDFKFHDEVPVNWIKLELALRKSMKDIMSLDKVYDIGRGDNLDKNTVNAALSYLHRVGEILHYNGEGDLKETVILNVGWLVDLFKLLITQALAKRTSGVDFIDIKLGVILLLNEGRLDDSLLSKLLREKGREGDKDLLVKIMSLYDILWKDPNPKSEVMYVPCFLRKYVDEIEKGVVKKKDQPCCPIYFHFPRNFLPEGLFYRLVVRCLKEYRSDTDSVKLFKHYARFVINQGFHFIIQKTGADIELKPLTEGSVQATDKGNFKNLCRIVDRSLKEIIGIYSPGLSYDICVKCPRTDHSHDCVKDSPKDVVDGCIKVDHSCGDSVMCPILLDYVEIKNLKPWSFTSKGIWSRICRKLNVWQFALMAIMVALFISLVYNYDRREPENTGKEQLLTIPRINKERQRSVLFLNDEWGTSKGGISSVNRQLALQARDAGYAVYVTLLNYPNDEDKADAMDKGINLIIADTISSVDHNITLNILNDAHKRYFPSLEKDITNLDVIIGHVPITSKGALDMKVKRFPSSKVILFIHVIPQDTDFHKGRTYNLGEIEAKVDAVVEQAEQADIVFSVGPKVYREFKTEFRASKVADQKHKEFIPIPDSSFFDLDLKPFTEYDTYEILTVGRMSNVENLKGYDIAAAALGKVATKRHVSGDRVRWRIRGLSDKDKDEGLAFIKKHVKSVDGNMLDIYPLQYGTQKQVILDIQKSRLFLMPSRTEPFGMVGLEAIAAGIPVLVTANSGLAEFLTEHFRKNVFESMIVSELGKNDINIDADIDKWENRITNALFNKYNDTCDLAKEVKDKLFEMKSDRKSQIFKDELEKLR